MALMRLEGLDELGVTRPFHPERRARAGRFVDFRGSGGRHGQLVALICQGCGRDEECNRRCRDLKKQWPPERELRGPWKSKRAFASAQSRSSQTPGPES